MMKSSNSKSSTSSCSWVLVFLGAGCLLMAIALGTGCGTVSVPPVKTYKQAQAEVEKRGPLVTKPIEERENYKPGTSKPIAKDTPAPRNGIIIDKDKAAYYIAIKAERDRRLKELAAARKKAAIQEVIRQSTIHHLEAKLRARATWWEQNKGLVGFGIGVTVGMAIIVGLVYGLTRGDGLSNSSTNTHVLVPTR